MTHYTWQDIFSLLPHYRRELILAHSLALLAALFSIPLPLLMPLLVDEVLLQQPAWIVANLNSLLPSIWQQPLGYIITIALLTMLLRLIVIALQVWQGYYFSLVAKKVIYRLRRSLLQQLKIISIKEYESLGSGQVTSLLVTDLNSIDLLLGQGLSRFVVSVLTIFGIALVLLWMHWQLALFILCLNPLVILFTLKLGRKVKHLKSNENKAFELFQESLHETLDAIQQIRAYNREHHYIDRVIEQSRHIRDYAIAWQWKSEAASRLSMGLFVIGFELFRATSMLMVLYSDLSIGQMLAIFGYLWFMMTPMQDIFTIQYNFQAADAALQRINKLTELKTETQYPARIAAFEHHPHAAHIELKQIDFAYLTGQPVLKKLNCRIEAGEKVAIIGRSGNGKSTLVNLLLGLYPADAGIISYNHTPIQDIGLHKVREQVASVLQQPALFNEDIRMNLCLGKQIDDAQLWDVLQQAQLYDVVKALPQGLDTLIGQQGIRLSGGQRQRIAIARLLLTQSKVVILDEATSALDSQTEQQVYQALHSFLKQRTVIMIAHHPQAIQQADRVLHLQNGQLQALIAH